MKRFLFMSMLGLIGFGGAACAASFDCAKAASYVEKTVCSDEGLSNSDEELARAYRVAMGLVTDTRSLKEGQQHWLRQVRNQCETPTCLSDAYDKRVDVLWKIATAGAMSNSIHYVNSAYGFDLTLPASWKGYGVTDEGWGGQIISDDGSDNKNVSGPSFMITHPGKTAEEYQGIPIMVFTLAQWPLVQDEKIIVGAAPMPPGELARNSQYVFALPARYNYAYPEGWEEVRALLAGDPVKGVEPEKHEANKPDGGLRDSGDGKQPSYRCDVLYPSGDVAPEKQAELDKKKAGLIRQAFADAGESVAEDKDGVHADFIDWFCRSDEHDKHRDYYELITEGQVSERVAMAVAKLLDKHYEPLPRDTDGSFLFTCKFADQFGDALWPTRYMLAKAAHGEYTSRYDMVFVGDLCEGYYHEADKLIDYGYVSGKIASTLAEQLKVNYSPKEHTVFGKRLNSLTASLNRLELYSAPASNAAWIAAEMPTSACGLLIAAEHDGSDSKLILAKQYLDKNWSRYSQAEGEKWLRRAAESGSDEARQLLGQLPH